MPLSVTPCRTHHTFPVRVISLACVVLASIATPARAQRAIAIDPFHPAYDDNGFLGVQGSRTPGSERVHVGWFTTYASSLLEADRGSQHLELVQDRVMNHLSAEMGIGGRSAIALALPAVLYQQGDLLLPSEADLLPTALGDPRISMRYRAYGDDADKEERHRDGPGLAIAGDLDLPGGAEDAYAGERATRLEARLVGDFQVLGAGVGGNLAWRHRFQDARLFDASLSDTTLGDQMLFGAALKIPVPPLYPLTALIEVRGETDFQSRETTALEGDIGARVTFDDVTLVAAVGTALVGGVGAPGLRGILGVWFAPSPDDADSDGIADDADQCPRLAEDRDGFQDEDGCADPDDDNDLIPDADDVCPREEALEGRDENEDGCTDPS